MKSLPEFLLAQSLAYGLAKEFVRNLDIGQRPTKPVAYHLTDSADPFLVRGWHIAELKKAASQVASLHLRTGGSQVGVSRELHIVKRK